MPIIDSTLSFFKIVHVLHINRVSITKLHSSQSKNKLKHLGNKHKNRHYHARKRVYKCLKIYLYSIANKWINIKTFAQDLKAKVIVCLQIYSSASTVVEAQTINLQLQRQTLNYPPLQCWPKYSQTMKYSIKNSSLYGTIAMYVNQKSFLHSDYTGAKNYPPPCENVSAGGYFPF